MMIVAPFSVVKSKTPAGITVYRIRLMCQGGKTPWTEEQQPIDDVLHPNGIFAKKTKKVTLTNKQECILAEIDTNKTDMSSMYDWHEIDVNDSETLCWRTFTVGLSGKTVWLPSIQNDCTKIIEAICEYNADI